MAEFIDRVTRVTYGGIEIASSTLVIELVANEKRVMEQFEKLAIAEPPKASTRRLQRDLIQMPTMSARERRRRRRRLGRRLATGGSFPGPPGGKR